MRIALYSDLHREMNHHLKGTPVWNPPDLDVDVVILAGDIGSHDMGIEWAASAFRKCPVSPEIIYIAGNHEYYGAQLEALTEQMRVKAAKLEVHFLENRKIEIGGVRFLGTTLWSDFQLNNDEKLIVESILTTQNKIKDYSAILDKNQRLIKPGDTIKLHEISRSFLESELSKPFNGKTVVITHFAPHSKCVEDRYKGSLLSPYFTVDMEPLMQKFPIDMWAFGHTHFNVDFIDHGCRVISNQAGYPDELSQNFREELVIDL